MSTLVTGDIHLTDQQRDAYRFEWLQRLPEIVRQHQATHLLILGDLTTVKNNHNARLVNRIADLLASTARIVEVVVLMGNHDYSDPREPFFQFLDHIQGVQFISEPREIDLPDTGNTLFLPHTTHYKREWEGIDFTQYPFIFAHNTFEGQRGDNGQVLHGIPVDVFPLECQVFSGDVHVAQKTGVVRCVGAPYLINFGDSYTPRMIRIDQNSHDSRNSVIARVTSIPMNGRQKRLIEVPCPEPIKGKPLYEWFADGLGPAFAGSWGTLTPAPGDIVKIRINVSGNAAEQNWPEDRKAWAAWAEQQGFEVWQVEPVIERRSAGSSQRPQAKSINDDATLIAYGKARKLDGKTMGTGRALARKK